MLTWRSERQIIIFTIYFLIVFIPFAVFTYSMLRKTPNCYDSLQNQDEQGVDCGGVCSLQCTGSYRDIKVNFTRGLKVDEGRYDIFALLENFNTKVAFPNVPYIISFYSVEGKLLGSASGTLSLLPQRRAVIYLPSIELSQEPKVVDLTLGEHKAISYNDDGTTPQNVVVNSWQAQRGANNTLQVIGEIVNPNTRGVENLGVYAMLYDETQTVYAVSKTVIPRLPGREETAVAYTWGPLQTPRNIEFIVIYE